MSAAGIWESDMVGHIYERRSMIRSRELYEVSSGVSSNHYLSQRETAQCTRHNPELLYRIWGVIRSVIQQTFQQGWEFAHRFSERITHFLRKNERMSDLLRKNELLAHLFIFGEQPEWFAHGPSFLVSDLTEALIFGDQHERFAHIAHFWWALSDLLTLLIFGEPWAHIGHQKWGNERIAHFLK